VVLQPRATGTTLQDKTRCGRQVPQLVGRPTAEGSLNRVAREVRPRRDRPGTACAGDRSPEPKTALRLKRSGSAGVATANEPFNDRSRKAVERQQTNMEAEAKRSLGAELAVRRSVGHL
jgi:hypothetical protein